MTVLSFGTDWLYLLVPLGLFAAAVLWLWKTGQSGERGPVARAIGRVGSSLERVTGLPSWAAAGIGTGLAALVVAVIGFLWDVAWHIDLGRDEFLATPAHMGILIGLMMIAGAGVASIAFATVAKADSGWRIGRLRIPWSGAALVLLGGGALLGFPLDELWHHSYGIDVTMWGPTHLLMIGGASLSPIALWLMLTEAGPGAGRPGYRRRLRMVLAGALLTGLSTFQAEFDFGVPQFQQLYHPVLIAVAASVALVAVRSALGRGGALVAAGVFIAIRSALVVLLGPALNLTVPVFPLYLGAAVAVEAAFALPGPAPIRRALAAGVGVGTVGLAAEWGWTHVVGRHPWGQALWPAVLVAVVAAVAGAMIGLALGGVLRFRRPSLRPAALAVAGLAVVGSLVVPFPRRDAPIRAEVLTAQAGPGRVDVTVRLDPADAATHTDWFEILSWQGGHSERHALAPRADGAFVSLAPVPVGGTWKSIVRLAREDVLVAAPVYLPKDEEIGAPAVPVERRREVRFERDTAWLMREAHRGPAWPAVVAYGSILAIAMMWIGGLTLAALRISRRHRRGRLAGRRVLLTGASGDIGAAAAAALRAEGAEVAGLDVVPGDGVLGADVRDANAVRGAVEEAARRLGGLDVVVNNAGVGSAQDAGAALPPNAREAIEVNLFGAWHVTAAAMPHLLAARGHVVHVASGLAIATVPWSAAYSASKRGLAAHGEALRLEYRGRITVTAVFPGYVRTRIHDAVAVDGVSLEGVVWPDSLDQAADAIVRACADRPRQVTTSFRTAVGLWIARHLPGVAEAFVAQRFRRFRRTRPLPTFVSSPREPQPRHRVGA